MVWIGAKYGQLKLVPRLRQSESVECLGGLLRVKNGKNLP